MQGSCCRISGCEERKPIKKCRSGKHGRTSDLVGSGEISWGDLPVIKKGKKREKRGPCKRGQQICQEEKKERERRAAGHGNSVKRCEELVLLRMRKEKEGKTNELFDYMMFAQ